MKVPFKKFNVNSAKSYVGKTVNLYLKDGSVMACVTVIRVTNSRLFFKASEHGKPRSYELREISRAEAVMVYDRI